MLLGSYRQIKEVYILVYILRYADVLWLYSKSGQDHDHFRVLRLAASFRQEPVRDLS